MAKPLSKKVLLPLVAPAVKALSTALTLLAQPIVDREAFEKALGDAHLYVMDIIGAVGPNRGDQSDYAMGTQVALEMDLVPDDLEKMKDLTPAAKFVGEALSNLGHLMHC